MVFSKLFNFGKYFKKVFIAMIASLLNLQEIIQ